MKNILITVLVSYSLLSCTTSNKTSGNFTTKIQKDSVFKEYALCSCLQYAFLKDSIDLSSKDASLGVYADLNEFDTFSLNKIDSLVKSVVNRMQPLQIADYNKKKAITSNCIQFYKSSELSSLIKELIKNKR